MSLKIEKQRQLLIDLRSQLIGSKHTLPFTIYSDDTIEDLLEAQPMTLEQLAKVKGFPANGKRLNGFGESVVAIFTNTDSIAEINVSTDAGALKITTKLENLSVF